MYSANSVSTATERYRGKPLAILIPEDFEEDNAERNKRLGLSLHQSWEKVVARFKKETGEDLGDGKSTKNGILGTLKQQYGPESTDTKKRDELFGTVENILNGVEVVGATAASVASIFFAPAQLCYNALDILFSIPRAAKKYGDDLQQLFKEVSSFLSNFKIYDRMDQRGMLDVELLSSNNDILISIVDLCLLAWKVIKSPIKTVLGNVFLKNDAIGAELGNFRDLVEKQNQLTNTMTLEVVLKNDYMTKQIKRRTARIEDTAKDTNFMVRGLAAESFENKNMKIDKDRITKIDRALELNEQAVGGPMDDLKSTRSSLLDETIIVLERNKCFRQWQDSSDRRRLLYIGGETSSGKTNVLSAIVQQIEDRRKKLHAQQKQDIEDKQPRDDRSIYLTYYSFSNAEKGSDRGRFDTPAHLALKVMAAQLARQSTRYAATFTQVSEKVKSHRTLQQLWEYLKLDDFGAPANSILYMLFDSSDQLKSSLHDLASAVRASKQRKAPKIEDGKLKTKIIFTGKLDASKKLPLEKDSLLDMSDINKTLIKSYVEERLQEMNIFQDDDDESRMRKTSVLDLIPQNSNGSFAIARQKLKVLEEAVEEDIEFQALVEKLQFTTFSTLADEGRKILDRLSSDLSVQHKEQLKELLMWSIYAKRKPDLNKLEAALFLQRDKKPLEPLRRKIEGRFDEALELVPDEVWPRDSIEEVLKTPFDKSRSNVSSDKSSGVTFTISVENADELSVRQIFSDLGRHVAGVNFEFSSRTSRTATTGNLYFHEGDAEFTIIARLLRSLNDDRVRRQSAPLAVYATSHLPAHLETFQASFMEKASLRELEVIGKGLINFLWDAVSISSAWNLHEFDVNEWFSEGSVRAMKGIIQHQRLQEQLDPVQRRWANNHTSSKAGKAAFLNIMASTAAQKWLVDRSHYVDASACFAFVDKYLDTLPPSKLNGLDGESGKTGIIHFQSVADVDDEEHLHPNGDISRGLSHEAHVTNSRFQQNGFRLANALFLEDEDDLYGLGSETASVVGALDERAPTPVHEDTTALPGNFSSSCFDIELVKNSILVAMCHNRERRPVPSSINLDDCLTNEWGKLRWKRNGKAFASASNVQLSAGGKILEMILLDGHGISQWQSIRLDEQIGNDDGRLVFLNIRRNDNDAATDVDETSSELESPLTNSDRLKRAQTWAIGNLKIDLDWFALTRLGHTWLNVDVDMAINTFQMVQSSPQNPWKSVGLSQAYASKEDYQKALEALQEALEIFRARGQKEQGKKAISKAEKVDYDPTTRVKDLFTCLIKAATYQKELENEPAAIEFLEEALACHPWASSCRWELIELLCKSNCHTRAVVLFDEWRNNFKKLECESPSKFIRRTIDVDTFQDVLMPAVKYSVGSSLYTSFRDVFEEAVDEADILQNEETSILLLYVQGLVAAMEETEDNIDLSRQLWNEALKIGHNLDDSCLPLYWCSRRANMYCFDKAMEDLKALPELTAPKVKDITTRLKNDIDQLSGPFRHIERVVETPVAHLAAIFRVAGQRDYIRTLLKQDMKDAIEIFTDENLHNDINGVDILVRVFVNYGDFEAAQTIWSLLNRKETRQRLNSKRKTEPSEEGAVNQQDTTNANNQNGHHDTAAAEAEHSDGSEDPNKEMYVWCDDCDEQLELEKENAESWWCTYCPDTVFCGPCMVKVRENRRRDFICSNKHEFVLLQHPEYTEEELRGNNVRIGWKWETEQPEGEGETNGDTTLKRVRTGGRIVDLKEWMEILRNEWDIETNTTEGKVQL